VNVPVGASADLLPASWQDYAEWVAVGKPACWAYPRQCHGDADGLAETSKTGTYYVGPSDLNVFLAAWQGRLGENLYWGAWLPGKSRNSRKGRALRPLRTVSVLILLMMRSVPRAGYIGLARRT
jgi:hypothetical protein